ncbi:phage tail protein [filamentous cyanobacterium LEGE 11480]|uniref:Phage tail protein n=1 Tax=Romeriopsis navalis LEGE 11480 TaxID=2777977 RepID=A0A928VRZ4_9CYAN|nr:phage tail protein [Romeriopsis navalis]MBE9031480.1 phage tail protein [Romeriopsis navalis LEGE 11480]
MSDQYELLTSAKYYLEITLSRNHEKIDGYFMDCQGFKRSQEMITICEVFPKQWGKANAKVGRVQRTKLPGNSKVENIILKRGLSISDTLWQWFRDVENGEWRKQRRDGDLTLYDQAAKEQARFRFSGAWPISYKIGDLKADSTDFEIEEVELAVESFIRVQPGGKA